mmetsp:Transcript_3949/g.9609  ORF Transcript_3949/g.9609 Transcript_3949/m.9609 type:complete len:239 (-) Transcript_3949:96-812(-)
MLRHDNLFLHVGTGGGKTVVMHLFPIAARLLKLVPKGIPCCVLYFGPYRGLVFEQTARAQTAGIRAAHGGYAGVVNDRLDQCYAHAMLGDRRELSEADHMAAESADVHLSFAPNLNHVPTADLLRDNSEVMLLGMAYETIAGDNPSSDARNLLRAAMGRGSVRTVVLDEADVLRLDGHEDETLAQRACFRTAATSLPAALFDLSSRQARRACARRVCWQPRTGWASKRLSCAPRCTRD